MGQQRSWSRTAQVIAASVVFIVLVAAVLVAQHPYTVRASTTTCTPPTTSEQAHATIAVAGPDTLTSGAVYAVTVKENSAVSSYPTAQLGFSVQVILSVGNTVELARQVAPDSGPLTPASQLSSTLTWTVPDTLLAGTYQFVPVIIAGGSELTLAPTAAGHYVVTGGAVLPSLAGASPYLTEVTTGLVAKPDSTSQQFAEMYIQNPTDTTQNISIHWQLWAGAAGTIPLLRNEATYAQTAAPGKTLSRPFFLDTHLFENGLVKATLTAGELTTTQWFRVQGAAKSNFVISKLVQSGNGLGQIGKALFGLCMATTDTIGSGTSLHILLTDASQTTLFDKVLTGSDLKAGEYDIQEYTLLAHWPLSISASTMVDGTEVSRLANTYQP